MMAFQNSTSSPPSILDPGSCQAVRIAELIGTPPERITITREESDRLQRDYAEQRKAWLEVNGILQQILRENFGENSER